MTSTIRRLEPDVLLIDVEMFAAVIATSHLGIPTLLPMGFFSIFRCPGLLPLNTAMHPGTTPWRRFKIQCAWWQFRMRAIVKRLRRRYSRTGIGDYFRPLSCNTREIVTLQALAIRDRSDTVAQSLHVPTSACYLLPPLGVGAASRSVTARALRRTDD
ncbi:MAG: hypothetical protein AB1Z31_23010 [Desulfobacterales bacterium]